jgi:RNA polymerase sigma-70 factor (ECF subfamily)
MKDPSGHRQFITTRWSLVGAARADAVSQARARAALEELCRSYWFPLYAFVRSRGHSADDAQDLVQAFFARILEKDGLSAARRERGRFRSYLLGAMKHFLTNEWHRQRTQKRGGREQVLDWEALNPETRYAAAVAAADDPDHRFDREWAMEIVTDALQALRDEMAKAGKGEQFEALRGSLTGDETFSREAIAARLGMSEGALKTAIHRLRRRYRDLLRAAIAETVSDEADLDAEMRDLHAILRRGDAY